MSHFVGNWMFPPHSALPAFASLARVTPWSELNSRVAFALFMHKLYESNQVETAENARRAILHYMDRHASWFIPCEKSKIYLVRNFNGQSAAFMINTVPR